MAQYPMILATYDHGWCGKRVDNCIIYI
jgi:hypothetical protein